MRTAKLDRELNGKRGEKMLARISAILIFILIAAVGAFGQALLVADAHTASTSPNGNFGTNPAITISPTNTAYVRFKISRTLPAGTKGDDVARATVKFYLNKVTTPGKLDVSLISSDWDEKTITANHAPTVGAVSITTQQINKDAQGNYFLIDITDIVKQWLGDGTGQNTNPNYGFALSSHPLDADTPQIADVNFDSKENSQTSHDGMLNVQLNSSSNGLEKVSTDVTLTGDGIAASPLGVAPGAISETYLADAAVTAVKLADGAVANSKLADNAVSTSKLADGSVATAKIANGAVDTTNLANSSVTSEKIGVPLSLSNSSPNFTLAVANSGTGPALTAQGPINTSTQYNIAGERILANPGSGNLFAGVTAGLLNSGQNNAFFGWSAGRANTTGSNNSFFGNDAGRLNIDGQANSFVGVSSGRSNTSGSQNTFFGFGAGAGNTTASSNTLVGFQSGSSNTGHQNAFFGTATGINTSGSLNSFFGDGAGNGVKTGGANTFVGWAAGGFAETGSNNTFVGSASRFVAGPSSGSRNTLLGADTKVGLNLSDATAIGYGALVTQNNSLILGGLSTSVGIGNTAPRAKLHITGGKIYVEADGQGMVLKSPNGLCFELTVSDAGALTTTAILCP
jgi:hypothetical protein